MSQQVKDDKKRSAGTNTVPATPAKGHTKQHRPDAPSRGAVLTLPSYARARGLRLAVCGKQHGRLRVVQVVFITV